MPSNPRTLRALPARFRRTRLLIVGCGEVGQRVAALLPVHVRVLALTSTPQRCAGLRAQGIVPLVGDLDRPATLARLAALGTRVLHLAPPPADGPTDTRTRALLKALSRRRGPVGLVYASTSGIYGDCAGAWVDESRAPRPQTPRGQRRLDAEQQLRVAGRRRRTRISVLRVPGIYAPDRPDGTPRTRLLQGAPVLHSKDDVYTSHIHSHDLARACIAALWRGQPQRCYNVCDDTALKMGDYMDLAADLFGLPRPPRVSREAAEQEVSPQRMRFMRESRRLRNTRMRRELRLVLRYPSVRQGLL